MHTHAQLAPAITCRILRQHLARPSTEQDDAYSGLWPDGAGIERGRGRGDDSALEDVEAASRARTGERQERLDPLVGLVRQEFGGGRRGMRNCTQASAGDTTNMAWSL